MHQTVVFYTDIDECSKIDYISHSSLQFHTWNQILNLEYVRPENRQRQFFPWITPWSLQTVQYISKCRHSDTELGSKHFRLEGNQFLCQLFRA
ncbi:hypothetical protein D3C80_1724090 [compost metagenome]